MILLSEFSESFFFSFYSRITDQQWQGSMHQAVHVHCTIVPYILYIRIGFVCLVLIPVPYARSTCIIYLYLPNNDSNRCRIDVAAAFHANCFPGKKNCSCFSFASDGDQILMLLYLVLYEFSVCSVKRVKPKRCFSMARSCDITVTVLERTQFSGCYTDTLNVIFRQQFVFRLRCQISDARI